MNLPQTTTPRPPGQQRHHEAGTQLSGRWLLMARGAGVSLVLLTLVSFVVLLPSYFAQLQTVCTSPTCALVQPTSESVRAMQQLGLSGQELCHLYVAADARHSSCLFLRQWRDLLAQVR